MNEMIEAGIAWDKRDREQTTQAIRILWVKHREEIIKVIAYHIWVKNNKSKDKTDELRFYYQAERIYERLDIEMLKTYYLK